MAIWHPLSFVKPQKHLPENFWQKLALFRIGVKILLAKIQQNVFFMTNHCFSFSFETFFLLPDRLCGCAQTLQIAP
jgi:hypothetical protein